MANRFQRFIGRLLGRDEEAQQPTETQAPTPTHMSFVFCVQYSLE